MNIFIILLLFFDLKVRAGRGFHQADILKANSQGVEMIVLKDMELNKCSKIIQPVCATNGKEFLYFQNKCHMQVKNYELLTQGHVEYFECPLTYCKTDCPNCAFIDEPVCAVELLSGEKKVFDNFCEVERAKCVTKRAWTLVNMEKCVMGVLNRILKPLNYILQNLDCPKSCPLEHRPVCARFMTLEREFSNVCELKAMICRSHQVWHIIRQGPCPTFNSNAGSQSLAEVSTCSKICPSAYKPICAKSHNELKVFRNRCELDKTICLFGHDWQVVKEGPCVEDHKIRPPYHKCPYFCQSEDEPVCARFGREQKEFRNLCELLKVKCITNTNWQLFGKGHCPLKTHLKYNCHKRCPTNFNPVCASNNGQLREFFNRCELDKISCVTNTDWKLVKSGSCPVFGLDIASSSPVCPQSCSKAYKPICAEFQSTLREFGNKCEMQKTICEHNTDWKLLKKGRCPLISSTKDSCFRICAHEFSPVCARFNGKLREFFNSCELEKIACQTNTNWEVLNRGPCFANQFKRLVKNSCEHEINDPVCGIFGYQKKTFDNVCQLAVEIERSGNIWSILHKGTCSDITTSTAGYLDENGISNSASKWATTTNAHNINRIPATAASFDNYAREGDALRVVGTTSGKIAISNEKDDDYDEEKDELLFDHSKEYYRQEDDADYGSISSEESSLSLSSDEDETVQNWVQAQINSFITTENQSDENIRGSKPFFYTTTPISKVLDKGKDAIFNYRGYSQEDDASNEINFQENYKLQRPWSRSVITNTTKTNEKYSVKYDNHEIKSKEPAVRSNNSEKGSSNRDNKEEKKYYSNEVIERKEEITFKKSKGKAKNVPVYEVEKEPTLPLVHPNSPANIKKAKKEHTGNTIQSQISISPTEQTQTMYNETNNNRNDKQTPKHSENSSKPDSFEENLGYGKYEYQQSSDQTNLKDNLSSNKTYMSENSHKTIGITPDLQASKQDQINSINNTEHNSAYHASAKDLKLAVNETSSKKGEIYNGVVYKAPVYDAPTYNFIYTAPGNYPGIDMQRIDQNNSFAKQLKADVITKAPIYPFQFFASLAAMNDESYVKKNLGPFSQVTNDNILKPNLGPLPQGNNDESYVKPELGPLSQINSDDSLKPILHYGQPTASNENLPENSSTMPTLTPALAVELNSSPPGKLPFITQPVSAPPSSKSYYSPSSTQPFTTPLNTVNTTQNSTLLNEIINTLKALTNQV